MSAVSVRSGNVGRLATIRRLYFYLVAFISLTSGLFALQSLLAMLLEFWFSGAGLMMANSADFVRNRVARDGGLLLVAAPIFVIHWAYVQGIARRQRIDGEEERTSSLRKLFLYAAAGLTLTLVAVDLHQLVTQSVLVLLGSSAIAPPIWPSGWLSLIVNMLLNLVVLSYFVHQLRRDGDLGRELSWAGTLRRIFQTLVGLIGLVLLLGGGSTLLEQALRRLLEMASDPVLLRTGTGWWQIGIAEGIASIVVGALLWWINWQRWEGLIGIEDGEARSALRRFYLYAATLISAGTTLVPAALLLYRLLLQVFGVAVPAELPDLAGPLSLAPLGLIAWRWHWRQVSREADRYGDSPESATVRRLYYYLVAAVGLVLLWLGLVDTLRSLLDWLVIGGAGISTGFRAEQLARGISFLAVGAPVWALHWRAVQSVARGEGIAAQAERLSGPRRAYLYGVALVGALLILFDLALVIYRVLLWALGDPNADVFGAETLDSVVRSGSAVIFWIVHVLAIRTDTRLTERNAVIVPTPEEAAERRAALVLQIEQLETKLAVAHAELAALNREAYG